MRSIHVSTLPAGAGSAAVQHATTRLEQLRARTPATTTERGIVLPQSARTRVQESPAKTGGFRAAMAKDRVEPAADLELLVGYQQVMPRMLDAIEGAKKVVNVEVFGMLPDGSGAEIGNALVAKARQGVESNLLVDWAGSFQFIPIGPFRTFIHGLGDQGVNVRVATRLNPVRGAAHVDHRKVVAVDGREAFIGGMNFSKIADRWHDVMVHLTGPAGALAGKEALDRWMRVGGSASQNHLQAVSDALAATRALEPGVTRSRLLVNAPEQDRFEITGYYRDRIRNAKERVWVASPGFTEISLIDELEAAARRGVDVRVLSPGKSPVVVPVTAWSARASYPRLMKHGGRAYETPDVAHTKALLVDDEATIGSFNVTKRSAKADHELNVVSDDPRFVGQVEQLFENDFARSKRVLGDEQRTGMQKFFDLVVGRLRIGY